MKSKNPTLVSLMSLSLALVVGCTDVAEVTEEIPTQPVVTEPTVPTYTANLGKCKAVQKFWQKNAYDNKPRCSNTFPPHTTTTYDVYCEANEKAGKWLLQDKYHVENVNNGTSVKEVFGGDEEFEAGRPMLREVYSRELMAPLARLEQIGQKMSTCQCPAENMISLENIEPSEVELFWGIISDYLKNNIKLNDSWNPKDGLSVEVRFQRVHAEVMAKLKSLDIGAAQDIVAVKCEWKVQVNDKEGATLHWRRAIGAGLSELYGNQSLLDADIYEFDRRLKGALGSKAVCNNEAELQGELFTAARDADNDLRVECHFQSDTCKGVSLMFNPEKRFKNVDKAYKAKMESGN